MARRLSPEEAGRIIGSLEAALAREVQVCTVNARDVQRDFWRTMRSRLAVNPQSQGLEHLDQLVQAVIDGRSDVGLSGMVLVLPAPATTTSVPPRVVPVLAEPLSSDGPATSVFVPTEPSEASAQAPSKRDAPELQGAASKKPKAGLWVYKFPLWCDVKESAPEEIRKAIACILDEAEKLRKTPWHVAYPWKGQVLWYDPLVYPAVYRSHYAFWMQHCRTFWHIALGAPLQSGSGFGSNGWRHLGLLLLFCSFMKELLDENPQLFWYGGKPSRLLKGQESTGGDTATDLVWLYRNDKSRYQDVLQFALERLGIDQYAYKNMRDLLESTDALCLATPRDKRLSDHALARVQHDLWHGIAPKNSWVGPADKGVWKQLMDNLEVRDIRKALAGPLKSGKYVPPSSVKMSKKDERVDSDDEGGPSALAPRNSDIEL
ncbi:hypothetical protein PHMEG_0007179 [Phytophthora megakarya]|uniref:Uncharacterized protein n=1 Tax=Phytophthora megakarya TaxID=4795 RepID=A0A225WNM8_9STRA|nr:hypothetical protein PHMEG_0007179 [Phytophthora megakarya]